jgi:S-adenosylmethionine:tRNA ribosyltransferase-isomerase
VNVSDFDYELAPERIAQRPADRRDGSRLLRLGRTAGAASHHRFDELAGLLRPGDLLVFNDTRVLSARLVGRKATGGRVELLLLEPLPDAASAADWRALLRAARKPAPGARLSFDGGLAAVVLDREGDTWRVRLEVERGSLVEALDRAGELPLPPYIERPAGRASAEDRVRYQTVFAREPGAVAAPTAGLHFTPELLERLSRAGIEQAFLTLHVGAGSFLPLRGPTVGDEALPGERFEVPAAVAAAVAAARERGGRVVAVGTTVVRALETSAAEDGRVRPGRGRCTLFIRPGYRFRAIDGLITNFHLPRTTLLMLVCALAGRERVLAAYDAARAAGYRFYSYGDAMLVVDA